MKKGEIFVYMIFIANLTIVAGCGNGGGFLDEDDLDFTLLWGVAVDDLDLDGAVDVAATYTDYSGDIKHYASIILNDINFPGSFFLSDEFKLQGSRGDNPTSITLGDLNDDGFLDIAAASQCSDCKITILFQDIANIGTFLPANKYSCRPSDDDPWSIAIGEMNNDNFNDLIISEDGFVIRFQDSTSPGNFLGRTKIYDPD